MQDDWDVLMGLLPNLIRELIAELFVKAIVLKDIFTKIFENPFWYFDGKTGPGDQLGDASFPAELQYLYERFLKSTCAAYIFIYPHSQSLLTTSFFSQLTPSLLHTGGRRLSVLPTRLNACRRQTLNSGNTTESGAMPHWVILLMISWTRSLSSGC